MTREEQIRDAANDFLCETQYMVDNVAMAFVEGAQWADNNPKTPWISVEERLPEPEKDVIILNKRKQVDIDFLTDDFEGGYYWWKSDEAIFCEDDEITHWMPIPELPKEERK